MSEEKILFIQKCFKVLCEKHPENFEIKKIVDYKNIIPDDMRDETNTNKWKLIESNIEEKDILEFEEKFNIKLPSMYKAFLCTYNHMFRKLEGIFDDFYQENNKNVVVYILEQPSSAPLLKVEQLWEECTGLIDFGYIPIADFNGWGPLCFDTVNNYELVWLDHEEYYDCESREELEELGEIIFGNFKQFMECFFCGITHECGI